MINLNKNNRRMILLAKLPKYLFGLITISILWSACKPKTIVLKSPPGYNFQYHQSKKLESKLNEISGIAWDKKRNLFIAEQDEEGIIYLLDENEKRIMKSYVFGEKGDYEDIAMVDSTAYILRSDGTIFKFNIDSSQRGVELSKLEIPGQNEFESMFYDEDRKALVMLCKKCAIDNNSKVSAFAYYIDSIGFDAKPLFQIDLAAIQKLAPQKTSIFQPSGAAIQPKQNKIYILSATSRQLAVTSLNGNVEGVYALISSSFPQPEGICFRKDGAMFISNEGANGRASLLSFSYSDIDTTKNPQAENRNNYDLSKPSDKMKLGKHLHEISGMAWIGNDMILAENDEKGDIYQVDFKNKKDEFKKIKFGGHGDYEDIVHTDDADYLLVSTGSIVQVTVKDSAVTGTKEYELGKKGNNEYETLYLDKADNSIIMLCKKCSHEKETSRSAFRFDLATKTFSKEPAYIIDIGAIQKMLNDDKAEFKPSAAAINPVNGKVFIVASVGKLLVVTDKKGNVEQVFKLDPNLFNQPEGMTFAPNGDLYISNEGGEGEATILKFSYKK